MTTKTKKILSSIGLLLAGVLIGIFIGYLALSPFNTWISCTWTRNEMERYAAIQYYKAAYSTALKAQEDYLSFLDRVEQKKCDWNTWSVPWMTPKILNLEKTFIYARMAILEERQGKTAAAEEYWQYAEAAATKLDWQHVDREHIRQVVNTAGRKYQQLKKTRN